LPSINENFSDELPLLITSTAEPTLSRRPSAVGIEGDIPDMRMKNLNIVKVLPSLAKHSRSKNKP
jgi:hypothetical protein